MKKILAGGVITACVAFLLWRFVRSMNIFVVDARFERPIPAVTPAGLESVSARECGRCHAEIYREWSGSMHAQAWTDPYFQVDFQYDDSQQICLNCHTPLVNQQEYRVLGFRDREKLRPILEPNPTFDPALRDEGVTCVICHLREGKIAGPFETDAAPHPVVTDPEMTSGLKVCARCHVVSGTRWDTFYRIPPCGTVAEIKERGQDPDCIGCHMPAITRPVAEGEVARSGRQHLFRGGHHPEQVRKALQVHYEKSLDAAGTTQTYVFELTNVGTVHYLPTGTPDRQLSLELRLRDRADGIIKEQIFTMKRHIMWRPFIIDLRDTRLAYRVPRRFSFSFHLDGRREPAVLDVTVRYHLLDEKRRKKIGYRNRDPIAYPVYQERISLY